MAGLSWPLRPLPDGRGEVWRWDLVTIAELPAARAALRSRLGEAGVVAEDDPSGERLVVVPLPRVSIEAKRDSRPRARTSARESRRRASAMHPPGLQVP